MRIVLTLAAVGAFSYTAFASEPTLVAQGQDVATASGSTTPTAKPVETVVVPLKHGHARQVVPQVVRAVRKSLTDSGAVEASGGSPPLVILPTSADDAVVIICAQEHASLIKQAVAACDAPKQYAVKFQLFEVSADGQTIPAGNGGLFVGRDGVVECQTSSDEKVSVNIHVVDGATSKGHEQCTQGAECPAEIEEEELLLSVNTPSKAACSDDACDCDNCQCGEKCGQACGTACAGACRAAQTEDCTWTGIGASFSHVGGRPRGARIEVDLDACKADESCGRAQIASSSATSKSCSESNTTTCNGCPCAGDGSALVPILGEADHQRLFSCPCKRCECEQSDVWSKALTIFGNPGIVRIRMTQSCGEDSCHTCSGSSCFDSTCCPCDCDALEHEGPALLSLLPRAIVLDLGGELRIFGKGAGSLNPYPATAPCDDAQALFRRRLLDVELSKRPSCSECHAEFRAFLEELFDNAGVSDVKQARHEATDSIGTEGAAQERPNVPHSKIDTTEVTYPLRDLVLLDDAGRPVFDTCTIIDHLQSAVATESWSHPSVSIQLDQQSVSLVIRQTREVHAKIAAHLRYLRRLQVKQICNAIERMSTETEPSAD